MNGTPLYPFIPTLAQQTAITNAKATYPSFYHWEMIFRRLLTDSPTNFSDAYNSNDHYIVANNFH